MRSAFAALVLFFFAPSSAQAIDGNAFIEFCTDQSVGLANGCIGYVQGLHDALEAATGIPGTPHPYAFCMSPGVQVDQLRDMLLSYVRDNPDFRHFPMGLIGTVALSEKFPCS